jgi:threonine/homoserine/homoserine lactone efflux protein
MDLGQVMTFTTISLLLVLVPGADWAYAIAAGLHDRSAAPAITGLLIGYLLITAVVAAGLAAVVAGTPALLTGLTAFGAVYLLWLGIETVRRPARPTGSGGPVVSPRRVLVRGIGISGFNPKAMLLFLALLPQFVSRSDSWPLALQIGTLGLLHTLVCAVVYSGVATTARRVLRARPAVARTVSRCSGFAMVAIAAWLLVEQLAR